MASGVSQGQLPAIGVAASAAEYSNPYKRIQKNSTKNKTPNRKNQHILIMLYYHKYKLESRIIAVCAKKTEKMTAIDSVQIKCYSLL